ncbi:helix-turn-helix transcriptional regulator [uncultured Umboniibacter sp.]|uniref:helix-turn-helix domain-containing protein n=1 Tax=uncultured Umboniibacter sp. TaxID=1798917 RepID=UPI002636B2DE|nr:helix-turn-helix transcriptional regulator [uncultured Umboniibacter sp.]
MKHQVQVIKNADQPAFAVLNWEDYQQLLQLAGISEQKHPTESEAVKPAISAETLRAIRESKGLSVSVLAREAGISPSYYEMIETGRRLASEANRRAIARGLKCSVEDIIFSETT